jgi:hypothetical protein
MDLAVTRFLRSSNDTDLSNRLPATGPRRDQQPNGRNIVPSRTPSVSSNAVAAIHPARRERRRSRATWRLLVSNQPHGTSLWESGSIPIWPTISATQIVDRTAPSEVRQSMNVFAGRMSSTGALVRSSRTQPTVSRRKSSLNQLGSRGLHPLATNVSF